MELASSAPLKIRQSIGWTSSILEIGHVPSVVDVWFVGSGEGLPSPLHWGVSRPTLEHQKDECTFHWTWRSNSKTWLLLSEKLNVESENLNVA